MPGFLERGQEGCAWEGGLLVGHVPCRESDKNPTFSRGSHPATPAPFPSSLLPGSAAQPKARVGDGTTESVYTCWRLLAYKVPLR